MIPRKWRRAVRRRLSPIDPGLRISFDAAEITKQLDAGMVGGWSVADRHR